MFVRKYILPVFLAALLLCSSITSVHAERSSNPEANAFYGTLSEIQAVTQQNELNEIPYPIDLTTPPGGGAPEVRRKLTVVTGAI
ncbi:hypothetical protein JJQ72_01420 [Paenibacillus sp. F411]|uniref:hypothetical protein n=1 Tax=Paenibacillus sp. F411 TaxID=2820239 RepID=UPI001AAF98FA|nr:hypothetical protein [Paenibacillus sp. F411]MBO2942643.1 hypothetical protein [Paenibacillus sp. F411]